MSEVFDFTDYKLFLQAALAASSKASRGSRSKFADAVQIQPSYVTKVLDGDAHLSLEQADRAASFLGLAESATQYFIALVEFSRAGTDSLKRHFERQIKRQREEHAHVRKQFNSQNGLSDADKNTFYSSWQYAAVLHALSIPRLRTKEAVATHFQLPLAQVAAIFEFLVGVGMVKLRDGAVDEIHGWEWLTGDAALIARDHMNWRLMAIRSYESKGVTDLHYSSVVSISEEDKYQLKKLLLEALERSRKVIAASKEETVCSLLVDFFEV
ncbi:MAG: TIGR02147 family protein [Bacteriovoracia bacterium]